MSSVDPVPRRGLQGASALRGPFTAPQSIGATRPAAAFEPAVEANPSPSRRVTVDLQSVGPTSVRLFGRALRAEEYADLVGAPHGSMVRVRIVRDSQAPRRSIRKTLSDSLFGLDPHWAAALDISVFHPVFRRQPEGYRPTFNIDIALHDGAPHAHLNWIKTIDVCPPGTGSLVVLDMAEGLHHFGVPSFELDAAGPAANLQGYYVWAVAGGTGKVPERVTRQKDYPYPQCTEVEQILAQPGGRAWWKANGRRCQLTFLTDPSSASMTQLRERVNGRNPKRIRDYLYELGEFKPGEIRGKWSRAPR